MKNKAAFLFCLLLASHGAFAGKDLRSAISARTNEKIVRTLEESQKNVYDYNGDGKINCIDYSCVFKLTWDKNFPHEKSRCTLIRNYQPGVMNHLFAEIRDEKSRDLEIETWASNPNNYLMYENWGKDRYNPTYNYYGETDKWLSERAISSGKTSHYTPASSHRGRYFSFGYTGLFNPEKIGCQLSSESLAERHESFSIIGIEYLLNNSMEKSVYALLIGYDWGYAIHPLFQPYFGGAAGINWTNSFSDGDIGFSWKICGGIRFSFSFFCIRAEISYSEILKEAGTVCVGLHF